MSGGNSQLKTARAVNFTGLAALIAVNQNGCLLWDGAISTNGYAVMKANGKEIRIARWLYEQINGEVKALVIDHICHTKDCLLVGKNCLHRRCIKPNHLQAITNAENIKRGNSGLHNRTKSQCPYGHKYDVTTKFGRQCRICRNRNYRNWYAKKKAGDLN